ncbi:hypothetical protein BC628DRAFT_1403409 [Trametes gibbosa]|nr:hypothetical protein BC628DRAFT_1403409 [Trametes gibbosa]
MGHLPTIQSDHPKSSRWTLQYFAMPLDIARKLEGGSGLSAAGPESHSDSGFGERASNIDM